jgi:hypothetical protein
MVVKPNTLRWSESTGREHDAGLRIQAKPASRRRYGDDARHGADACIQDFRLTLSQQGI